MEDLESNKAISALWGSIVDIWNMQVVGVTLGSCFLAILLVAMALLGRGLFRRLVLYYLKKLSRRTKNSIDDAVVEALAPPIRAIPLIIALLMIGKFLIIPEWLENFLLDTVRSLMTFVLFWMLFQSVTPLSSLAYGRSPIVGKTMIDWTIRVTKIVIIAIGAAAILEIWGIKVGAILAGLGLVGVAVALGAQDLFKNLIAGTFVIIERRFQNGNWIKVDGVVEGTVEVIGLRTTKICRFDMAPVYVPNSELADGVVINFSRMTYRRISWTIALDYRTTVEQLKIIRNDIEKYILGSESFIHPPKVPTFIRIDAFDESSIDLMIYCFTSTTDWGEWLSIKELLVFKVKDIVDDAGARFAFPTQSIYIEKEPVPEDMLPSPHHETKA